MTTNPNNFPGATIDALVGTAGGPWEVRQFPNGNSQAEQSIAVSKGYKNKQTGEWVDTGTDWYTLTATEAWANDNWPDTASGDKLRVEGSRLEARAYAKKDGTPGVELKLSFGTLNVVESRADRAGSGGGGGGGGFGQSSGTPFC